MEIALSIIDVVLSGLTVVLPTCILLGRRYW